MQKYKAKGDGGGDERGWRGKGDIGSFVTMGEIFQASRTIGPRLSNRRKRTIESHSCTVSKYNGTISDSAVMP